MGVTARAFRGAVALATVGGALLIAPAAPAQSPPGTYTVNASVDGASYVARGFRWNEPQELTFTRVSDSTSQALLNMAGTENHTVTVTETYSNLGKSVAVVTLLMTGVRVMSVRTEGSVANPAGPEETVVLHFKTVKYTFQPYSLVTATGAGAAVTVSYPPFPGERGDRDKH